MSKPVASVYPKLIYFAYRLLRLDRQRFVARWREHGELGMSMTRWEQNIHRYVQCDTSDAINTTWSPIACDGVAMVWYRSEATRLRHGLDPHAAPVMKADEQETFARPVRETSLLTDEYSFEPFSRTPNKLFVRVTSKAGHSRSEFRQWWLGEFGPAFVRHSRRSGMAVGYTQNHRHQVTQAQTLCDCIDEIEWVDAVCCESAYNAALEEVGATIGVDLDMESVSTVETLLYSR